MFYFWGDCFLKESTSFKIFNPTLGPNLQSFWEPCLFSGTYFFGFRDGRGPPTMTHQAERLLRNHVPHRDRSDGAVRGQLLPMARLTRSLGSLKHGPPWQICIFSEWTWRMVFLGFLGGKKIRIEIFSLKIRLWCGILGHTLELSPKHYQKEESLVMVLVLNPSSFLPSKIWRSTAFWKEHTIRTFCLISGGYCSSKIRGLELWHVTCSFILNIWNLGIVCFHPEWTYPYQAGIDVSSRWFMS